MSDTEANWFDRHFVDNWRESWRWLSTQSMLFYGATATTVTLNADILIALTGLLPESGLGRVVVAFTVLVFTVVVPWLMRIWNQQEPVDERPNTTPE
jgi:hypothetical protein